MDIASTLSNTITTPTIPTSSVPANNANVESQSISNGNLGKDDFLKLLVTQLKYQDPTQPLEDKEFISQMAQFTSLEQITNLSKNFEDVSLSINKNYAVSLLGKNVEVLKGDQVIRGRVSEIGAGATPQIGIDGVLYNLKDISRVGVQEVQ